jgi:GAF domain-containing protein
MISEAFCSSCIRTVYADEKHCPVCSTTLIRTGHSISGVTDHSVAVDVGRQGNTDGVDPTILPPDEDLRIEAVQRYEILDTPRDGAFDRVTRLAAQIFDVPISTVTIVDSDRIWFKSAVGLEADQIDREPGLCASAILSDEAWIVEDARKDPRSLENPLVLGELGVRFYAGVPLKTADGHNLGMLNIIDREPRALSETEVEILSGLAQVVVDELELRLAARRLYKDMAQV